MTITYWKTGNYERYQVRITRHGKSYSKAFSCAHGKRKALLAAKEYEAALLEMLGAEPLTSAGKKRDKTSKLFNVTIQTNSTYGTQYATCRYRNANGHWAHVARAINPLGLEATVRLVRKMAKERHIPAEPIKRKKMPSKSRVEETLGFIADL
jgi:hypothetical protein